MKPEDTDWQGKRDVVFQRITETVKSAPCNTDPEKPTWWQKILLYDPIVLEDFTAWLNEQGIRVQWRRKITKKRQKKIGRPKKVTERHEDLGSAHLSEGVDFEFVEDPLQGWMVQKWCEEKSVCCVWKDGVRAKIKSRY